MEAPAKLKADSVAFGSLVYLQNKCKRAHSLVFSHISPSVCHTQTGVQPEFLSPSSQIAIFTPLSGINSRLSSPL
jgi:hypothetical protein